MKQRDDPEESLLPRIRRIGRTRSRIVALEKALGGKVLLIEKEDGSIYALLKLDGAVTRIKA
jgi:hypothetical protein